MTIYRTYQGAWEISAIIDKQRFKMQYMGYTKREAIERFKVYLENLT